jgi:para-nitrobenzyl esterase
LEPSIETTRGRLTGTLSRDVATFRGIPYARPPVGALRFQPPQPAEPWSGERRATRPGPVPVQAALPYFRFVNAGGARQSEDCLHLNVWTPGLDDARRPVLVWIHGGAFLVGSGSTPIYEGSVLARRGDLVVVTINYRLGALGFVHLDGVAGPAFEGTVNLGVHDQIAALEWVRDNIERFGGDPNNVTVCGQSAGAMSIAALLGAPRARSLFQRAILQSGAARHVLSREKADEVGDRFLWELRDVERTPEAFGAIPVERILKVQGVINREMMNPIDLMVMLPCVDGSLIDEQPLDAVRRGATANLSMMIGTTLEEWKLFSPLEATITRLGEDQLVARFGEVLPHFATHAPEPEVAARHYREAVRTRGGRTTPVEVWSAFQSTRVFHHPAHELADLQARNARDVYSYLFSWRPPALGRTLGACHAMELPFVFGLTSHPAVRPFTGFAGPARKLSRRMQHAWIAFAHGGNPGHDRLPEWDRYDRDSRPTMIFDRECSIADGPLDPECRLIDTWR